MLLLKKKKKLSETQGKFRVSFKNQGKLREIFYGHQLSDFLTDC